MMPESRSDAIALPVLADAAPPAPMTDPRPHLLDWDAAALGDWLLDQGEPRFRANQVFRWVTHRRVASFEAMTDLPKKLRVRLQDHFRLFVGEETQVSESADGTVKLLIRWPDGGEVECVLLRDGHRRSICVSSQVGCAMGCVFCASGLDGVERNLTRGEIVEQMLRLQAKLPESERLSHIVMMGMGEPLANLDRVLAALDVARAPEGSGLGISPRRVTISTVGLPPAIRKLAVRGVPFNLAVSLHAPDDELRDRLVPVNRKVGVQELMAAADDYFAANGRRLTFEYVLLGGINDDERAAHRLVSLLRPRNALLNVIPYNPVAGLPYRTPSADTIGRFRQILEKGGVTVQFRKRKGSEIDAACGQLRRHRRTADPATMPCTTSSAGQAKNG